MAVPVHALTYLEIVTPDVAAACQLYSAAYGWTFAEADPALGGARVATLPGGGRCGIRAPMRADEPPTLRPYMRVDDVEAAMEAVEALGASVLLGPMALPGHGRIAIYLHGGVEQGLWELP